MTEADQTAARDAMAELCHLENRSSRDEAIQVAIAQMVGAAAFLEAHAGKAKADAVVGALWRSQMGDQIVLVYEAGSSQVP